MPINGSAVTLTAGVPVQIPNAPGVGSRKLAGIVLQNVSPFALVVAYGAHTEWVSPFQAWPIPQSQLGQVTVTPTQITPAVVSGSVLPTYYLQGESMPTTPVLLSNSSQQNQVELGTIATGTGSLVTLPGGCLGLLMANTTTAPVSGAVVGQTSGAIYFEAVGQIGQGIIIPVAQSIDPIVKITNSSVATLVVIALFSPQAEPLIAVSANITEIGGASLFLGQTTMANSIPVVIASNQSAVQVGPTLEPGGNAAQLYLPVLQRPTLLVATANTAFAANTGVSMIGAPGAGYQIVLRKIMFALNGNPAANSVIEIGTASGDASVGRHSVVTGVAAFPGEQSWEMDWEDYAIGDNLPLYITCTTALNMTTTITYSLVRTANWPTS